MMGFGEIGWLHVEKHFGNQYSSVPLFRLQIMGSVIIVNPLFKRGANGDKIHTTRCAKFYHVTTEEHRSICRIEHPCRAPGRCRQGRPD